MYVCLCQRFENEAKGSLLHGPHLLMFKHSKLPSSREARRPLLLPLPLPILYQHQKSWLRRSADDFITPPPFSLSLCHSILITLIKSFVHLEISDDNLFHSTLQQWWL